MLKIIIRTFASPILAIALLAGCGDGEAPDETQREAADRQAETRTEPTPPQETTGEVPEPGALLDKALTGDHRKASNVERDKYRHPRETLEFFGLKPDMTVVELWPGGGWYTEVLAPVLHEHGKLVAAGFDKNEKDQPGYRIPLQKRYEEKLAKRPDVYGDVKVIPFNPPKVNKLGPEGSADMVVTFRNFHNWVAQDAADAVFRAAFDVLKPGGVFGVVQHRADEGADVEKSARHGYVPEGWMIEQAEAVGFELDGKSEVNANPADTHDHEAGVWTLPPSYRICDRKAEGGASQEEIEACKKKYDEIGESDRMTLRFVKPE